MTFFNWRDPAFRRDLMVMGSWKDPTIRHALVIFLAAATCITGVGLFFAGIPFTNPSYCGGMCHAVAPQYQAWSKSSHAGVACHICHDDSAYVGATGDRFVKPISRLALTRQKGLAKPINADSAYARNESASRPCFQCHRDRTGTKSTGNLKLSETMHPKHLKAGMVCTNCHNRVAHPETERYLKTGMRRTGFKYKDLMTMEDGCWRCHSEDAKYRNAAAVATTKGRPAPTECRVCHNPNSTLTPTKGPLNHGPVADVPWTKGRERHGKIAALDFNVCFACHERRAAGEARNDIPDCSTACHGGVAMPHNTPGWAKYFKNGPSTPAWLKTHPESAKANGVTFGADRRISDPNNTCSLCHNRANISADFCQKCHHERFVAESAHPEAPWRDQHSGIVKEVGSGECQSCHPIDFCSRCHLSGDKALRAGL